MSYKDKKVLPIGSVSELTGLSLRKIRYYEERGLILPDRSGGGTRKFSFTDVEKLMDIANQIEDGMQTFEIKKLYKKEKQKDKDKIRDEMIRGQLNAAFKMTK
ncbi:MerR family transcriptional regulator [Bacillus hwajinpoensis]|jgi:MerR family transcriptional regulator, global nitrogen regulator|uniref:MerR family transcriptional regulator n=1 Tax=Guptibacillus hwajinpoensis TaxID=208199 RepID=A0A845EXH6_9BACL|nr:MULTISPECIES: MerR family transcriptional regulator [Bacillaceae]MCA0171172.1 MerR family transcriptional regulator [Bacillus sp. RAR_GA_16]MCA0990938.1 MerR family transcriptional regulator [Pseudalkalibacillus hwajinpoensis]MYL63213.1 MerR family transcriptional regulator [Pseudalkalibacillus hwajinpoensis]PFG13784.1 transcriptional regulator [Bacillus sp. es.036]QHA92466.1 MerR family transcriptional regulator [Bacillus sp. N1-1]